MNDIHDIYGPISLVYQYSNFFYFLISLLLLLLFLIVFFFRKKNLKSNQKENIYFFEEKINNLDINKGIEELLNEISLIIKEYIEYKKNINCKHLTTEEISYILKNSEIITILKKIDYFKYSYIKTQKEDISKIIIELKKIIKF